jgi:hypothetical protein
MHHNLFTLLSCGVFFLASCKNPYSEIGSKAGGGKMAVYVDNRNKPPCEYHVQYQGTNYSIKGIELPIGAAGGKIIKVGGVDIKPEKIREVNDKIQTLDYDQKEKCEIRNATPNPTPEQISEWSKAQNELTRYVLSLAKSGS